MTVPGWWAVLLIGLGVFRICRLVGWDDITTTLRERFIGISDEAHSQWTYVVNAVQKVGDDPFRFAVWHRTAFMLLVSESTGSSALPPLVAQRAGAIGSDVAPIDVEIKPPQGGLPERTGDQFVPFSKRRWYWSKMLRCPWCLGWWVTLAVWLVYQTAPHGTLVVMSLFAASAIPGLVTKNLDH